MQSVNIQITGSLERCFSQLNVFTCLLRIVETADAVGDSGFPISWQSLKYKPECEQGKTGDNWISEIIEYLNTLSRLFVWEASVIS